MIRSTRSISLLLCALLVWLTAAPIPAPAAPHADPPPYPIAPLASAPFGLNTHLATRYHNLNRMDIPADRVAEAGVGWAREDIHWWRIQPRPDTWDWSYTDAALGALLARRISILGVLGHPPGWGTPSPADSFSGVSFYAPDPDRFVDFATAVVRRYSRYVRTWEIWNEPDNPLFWKPAPDPTAYAALLVRTSAAIRAIDPRAKVLIGGLNPFDTGFLRQVAASGAWDSFDILAIHPYVVPSAPEAGSIAAAADGVRALAATLGPKPIWATEVGWPSGPGDHDPRGATDAQAQASYLVRSALLLWLAGVERIFWYTLKDDPGNPYGLFAFGSGYNDYTRPKPAFYALRTLNQQIAGAELVGVRDLFQRDTLLDFELFNGWSRGEQLCGSMGPSAALARSGRAAAQIRYSFPSDSNDYAVFARARPAPIPGAPHALGLWVYGDSSGSALKLWLRDAQGEVLQYALGAVGPPGWRLLQTPLGGPVADWNRISVGGNGRLDLPASLEAIVIDDSPDGARGSGTIFIDDLIAISGPEAYDIHLRRGEAALDIVWAPGGLRAAISSAAAGAQVIGRDGQQAGLEASEGKLVLNLAADPAYIQHAR